MKKILSIVCILVSICCCSTASAAIDIFVKINGINGTSVTAGFTTYSDVEQTGLVTTSCATSGSGTNACPGVAGNFNFQMPLSEVMPQLQARLFQGTVISSVDFVFRKASGTTAGNLVYYQVHLEGVRVASIAEVGNGSDNPSEQYSFAFQKIAWKYTAQSSTGGAGTSTYGCYSSTGPGGTGTGSNCSSYTFPF